MKNYSLHWAFSWWLVQQEHKVWMNWKPWRLKKKNGRCKTSRSRCLQIGSSRPRRHKIIVLSGWRTGCLAHLVLISTNPITGRPMPLKIQLQQLFSGSVNVFAKQTSWKIFLEQLRCFQPWLLEIWRRDLPTDNAKFRRSTDVLRMASLFGYKLNKWVAISSLGEYSSSLFNFKQSGYHGGREQPSRPSTTWWWWYILSTITLLFQTLPALNPLPSWVPK